MLCQFLLYNKVNQLYVYIYPHIHSLLRLPPTLPIPPLTKRRADLPVLCSCLPLAIYFTSGSIYIVSATLSLRPSLPFALPVSLSPFSIRSASLFLSCPQVLQNHFFFRLHIYVLAYVICFSLSDIFHSVGQTLGPSTSLQITQFHFFLWLSNIPLYICATPSLSIHLSMDTYVASMSWLL